MSRIGIFAGVFDPIHRGHACFIQESIKDKKLDKLFVIVEEEPKYKKCLADYEHRRNMVSLAVRHIPEARLYESPRKFFPISATIPKIRKENPSAKLFLLLGDDVKEHIASWDDVGELLQAVDLVVARRNQEDEYSKMSSLKARSKLQQGRPAPELDENVLDYCKKNGLYLATGA